MVYKRKHVGTPSYLVTTLVTKKEDIIQSIADHALKNEEFKVQLFEYIELSKRDEFYATAAANAITGLNRAGISFSGMDLGGIRIPNANLTNAILDYTNLESADLSNVRLNKAWLLGANLKNSNMLGTSFGELAYKKLNGLAYDCAYSSDNQYFVATAGHEITIYRVGKAINLIFYRTLAGHIDNVRSVAFSYDNQRLASGSEDNTICLWSLTDPKNNQTLTGHTGPIFSVAFSPNNQWLASGSKDNIIRLWSLTDPNNNQTLTGHTRQVNSVAFSPDNQWLASGSDDYTVRLWHLTDPNNNQILTGHTDFVNSVAFSPDNQWIASGSDDDTIRRWNLKNPTKIQILTGHVDYVNSVAFSPDNQWIASGSKDNTVRLWNLEDPSNNRTLTGHISYIYSVTFSPDNLWLASGSVEVRFWSLKESSSKTITGHTRMVRSVAFSPDNQWLASGSDDDTVRLWSLTDPNNNQTLTGHTRYVLDVTFSPDNQWLASGSVAGSVDDTVRLWSLTDTNNNHTLKHTSTVRKVAFSPDNQWLAIVGYENVLLWNLTDPNNNQTLITGKVNSVAFSPDNQWLASGSEDNTICLWSLTDPNNNQTRGHTWPYSPVNSVVFSPDNQWLASGSDDYTVSLWSLTDPNNNQTLTGHTGKVNSVAFSPDNQWLASCSGKNIIIWSVPKKNSVNARSEQVFVLLTNFIVSSLAYQKVDAHLYLATGGFDCSVRLWEHYCNENKLVLRWATCQTLCANQADITNATLSSNNSELLLQRGATGEPIINDATKEPTDAAEISDGISKMQLIEPTPLLFSKTLIKLPKEEVLSNNPYIDITEFEIDQTPPPNSGSSLSKYFLKERKSKELWFAKSEVFKNDKIAEKEALLEYLANRIYAYYGVSVARLAIATLPCFYANDDVRSIYEIEYGRTKATHILSRCIDGFKEYGYLPRFTANQKNFEIVEEQNVLLERGLGHILAVAHFIYDINVIGINGKDIGYCLKLDAEEKLYAFSCKINPGMAFWGFRGQDEIRSQEASQIVTDSIRIAASGEDKDLTIKFVNLPQQTKAEFIATVHDILGTPEEDVIGFFKCYLAQEILREFIPTAIERLKQRRLGLSKTFVEELNDPKINLSLFSRQQIVRPKPNVS